MLDDKAIKDLSHMQALRRKKIHSNTKQEGYLDSGMQKVLC